MTEYIRQSGLENLDEELMTDAVDAINALESMYSRARLSLDGFKLSDDDDTSDRIASLCKINNATVFSHAVITRFTCDYMGDDDDWDSEVADACISVVDAINALHVCAYSKLVELGFAEPLD